MKFRDKIALIYARRKHLSAPTSWRTGILFLAFLIPGLIGQRAAAQAQLGSDYALIIDVYAGELAPAMIQEKTFSLGLVNLYKGVQPDQAWLPKGPPALRQRVRCRGAGRDKRTEDRCPGSCQPARRRHS
jgi:hypothetical protein